MFYPFSLNRTAETWTWLFRDSRSGIAIISLILLIPNTRSRDFTRGYIP